MTVFNCLEHGIVPLGCTKCAEAKGRSDTPMPPEVKAVVDAAVNLEEKFGSLSWELRDPMGRSATERADAIARLRHMVRAYLASTQPQGKRPEEVEPGTIFYFADGLPNHHYRLMNGPHGFIYTSVEDGGGYSSFLDHTIIIPITGEGE